MSNYGCHRFETSETNLRAVTFALALTILFALVGTVVPAAQAQTYTVIHNFTGGEDGANPYAGVTIQGGSLYGTTFDGGSYSAGAVYQLKKKNGGWIVNPLFSFDVSDGSYPWGRVTFGPDGALHGTTSEGGTSGAGTVFKLQPSATACKTSICPWDETLSYSFTNGADGCRPIGDLTFDSTGNIYGTTADQCAFGSSNGTVYELSPPGTWGTETTLYTFTGDDGASPWSGVIFDRSGNLYGTTLGGGHYNYGTVFQLIPSGPPWTENRLYTFQGGSDGGYIVAGLVFDSSGNLYGAASYGSDGGTAYTLSSAGEFSVIGTFSGQGNCANPFYNTPGPGPWASLTFDTAGNLYGTTCAGGAHGYGNVFELSPNGSNWRYTDLYDFTGGNDGGNPISNVSMDSNGNLYGTASSGGTGGVGVVWEITP